jgi:hypothetical protein
VTGDACGLWRVPHVCRCTEVGHTAALQVQRRAVRQGAARIAPEGAGVCLVRGGLQLMRDNMRCCLQRCFRHWHTDCCA